MDSRAILRRLFYGPYLAPYMGSMSLAHVLLLRAMRVILEYYPRNPTLPPAPGLARAGIDLQPQGAAALQEDKAYMSPMGWAWFLESPTVAVTTRGS